MAIRSKGPMGLSTKILLGSAAFGGLAIFFPDAIFYVALAVSVVFVFLWWSRTKGQKGGRLILPLLLVGMPWGIFDTFYKGVAAGEHEKTGFFMDSLTYGVMIPFALYIAFLLVLMFFEFVKMTGEMMEEGDKYSKPKDEPGPLARFWWI